MNPPCAGSIPKFFGFEEKRKGIVSILIFHLFSLFVLMKLKLLTNRALETFIDNEASTFLLTSLGESK